MDTAAGSRVAVWLNLAHAIGGTRTLDEILAVALDALETVLGVSRASILLFDPDGVMRFKAYRDLSDEYRQAVEGHTPWRPDTPDPEPLIVADVTREPSLAAYLPVLRSEGIAAMAFIPLVSRGRVIGKFMLYYATPRGLDPAEVEVAGLIASHIAFAVERTRSEELARRDEERLRFALDAANMGTWDWDLKTQSVRWSDNVERLHGLPAGSFDGTFESYSREIHPEDREKVLGSIKRALATGSPHEVEYRIVAPDGTVRWVEGKGRVEHGPDGRPVRMTGVCLNVTRRKEAELARVEALEQAHGASQRLAAIVQSSGDAIVSKTLDGIITSWNGAAERMFGYSAEEAIGQSITLIIPRERLPEEDMVLGRIRAGQPVEMETIRQYKDGKPVPISLMVSPIRDSRGHITGASKIARDIGARKRAEAARAELQRRLATLVDASATLLNSPDTASVVAATITAAQRLLVADGYAIWTTPPTGQTWQVVKSQGISAAFANRIVEQTPSDTAAAQLESGPLAVAEVSTSPALERQRGAYDEEGIRSMLVCPMRLGDTRRGTLVFYYRTPRTLDDVDVETGQTLANLVAAAMTTADLYEQLRAERNAAEAAYRQVNELNRVKDDFLATLSHELRTPLNAILGYAQMLGKGSLGPERQSSAIAVLTRNAESLKQMIEDVLDVSRVASGKLRLMVRPVDLSEILDDAIATIQPGAQAKGITLQPALDRHAPPVSGDPDRLRQIVWNLLSNAVKFSPRGGQVDLRLEAEGSAVRIVISDQGQGIDPAFLPHVFERFRQGDSRGTREQGGLGLGLAIVRELTELHGGTVAASSEGLGKGATFTVSLPSALGGA